MEQGPLIPLPRAFGRWDFGTNLPPAQERQAGSEQPTLLSSRVSIMPDDQRRTPDL